jgi:glutathione S-transferase
VTGTRPVLVTIPFSHYCEKARWALDRAGIDYEERRYPPGLHRLGTRSTGGRSVPVLILPERALTDSSDILAWVDARAPHAALFGRDDAERKQVLALEDRFDVDLGPAARRVAYFHLLADTDSSVKLMTRNLSRPAAAIFRAGFPLLRAGMRRMMRIDRAGAERSLEKVRAVFSEVAARIAGGRRYLVGARLTAADITFAALATPMLAPPEVKELPAQTDVPQSFLDVIGEMRATPAGELGLRLYREERAVGAGRDRECSP